MVDCVCGFGKAIPEDQPKCPNCGMDVTLLHNVRRLADARGETAAEHGTRAIPRWFYAVPVATFAVGLLIMPLFAGRNTPAPAQAIDLARISGELRNRIAARSSLTGSKIEIKAECEQLRLTGSVPSELHKDLLAAIVEGSAAAGRVLLSGVTVQQAAAATQPTGDALHYTVRSGDTLTAIAVRFYHDGAQWMRIYEANRERLSTPASLEVGQDLTIPRVGTR